MLHRRTRPTPGREHLPLRSQLVRALHPGTSPRPTALPVRSALAPVQDCSGRAGCMTARAQATWGCVGRARYQWRGWFPSSSRLMQELEGISQYRFRNQESCMCHAASIDSWSFPSPQQTDDRNRSRLGCILTRIWGWGDFVARRRWSFWSCWSVGLEQVTDTRRTGCPPFALHSTPQ